MCGEKEIVVIINAPKSDVDHFARQPPGLRLAEAVRGARSVENVPIAVIAKIQVEIIDQLICGDWADVGSEVEVVVSAGGSVADHRLVAIRRRHDVASENVVSSSAVDQVIAAAASNEIDARAAIDVICFGAAEELVVAIAAADFEPGDARALLQISRSDAPGLAAENIACIGMHDIVAGPRVNHGVLDVLRLVENKVLRELPIWIGNEALIGNIPEQAGEFVAVEECVVTNRNRIRNGTSISVEITTEEQNLIVAWPAVEAVAQRRNASPRSACDEWKRIRDELKDVIAFLPKEQVAGLPIQPAAENVVAGTTEDPIFTRTAGKNVVA